MNCIFCVALAIGTQTPALEKAWYSPHELLTAWRGAEYRSICGLGVADAQIVR